MSNIYKKRLMGATALSALALGVLTFNAEVTQAEEGSVERIQGDDRYETATLISSQAFESSDTVIIANAMEFADALSGVPLAYEKEAPILLAYGSKLRAATLTEIERLGAKEAVILGGDAAISQSIENELKVLGLSVQRLSGDNRYETSAIIANELAKTAPSDKAVVVDGMEFADAMSIAPFAAQEGMPIYLTKTNSLSNAEELKDYSETYIVGGENAVSKIVEDALNSVTRLAGLDRYETNRKVLDYFEVEANELYVSTGLNFADALTGSVLAARNNSAVVLVKGDVHSKLLAQFEENLFNSFTILGGEAAVSNRVKDSLDTYIESKTKVTLEEKLEYYVDYNVEEVENNNLSSGEINIIQEGQKSYDVVTYEVTYVNSVEIDRVEVNRTAVELIEVIKEIGTQVTEIVEEVVIENVVAYETVTQENDQLPKGDTRIVQEGKDGYDEVSYGVIYVNGEETDRLEIARTTIKAIEEIKEIGTQVTEIVEEVVTENVVVYETVTQENDQLPKGDTRIVQEGKDGYDEVSYEVTYVNSKVTEQIELSRQTTQPIAEVLEIGTQVITKEIEESKVNFIEYQIIYEEDDSLPTGQNRVVKEGLEGYELISTEIIYINGVEHDRKEVSRITVEPINKVISVGTQVTETIEYLKTEKVIGFITIEEEVDTLPAGEREVVQEGQDGYDEATYEVTYVNNVETNRKEINRITVEPVKEIIQIGKFKLTDTRTVLNGLSVQITKVSYVEKESYNTFSITYKETNNTEQRIGQDSFKLYLANGTNQSQYGFFNTLMPGESAERTYYFELLKSEQPNVLEYGDVFFNSSPKDENATWDVSSVEFE